LKISPQIHELIHRELSGELSTLTNLQFTATGFGGGYHSITSNIGTDSNKTLRLDVTLTGTQLQHAWYGQSPGHYILTNRLSAGVNVQAETTPGFYFCVIHMCLFPSL
jgi:hypothetical protein